jgi:hypothetical protein
VEANGGTRRGAGRDARESDYDSDGNYMSDRENGSVARSTRNNGNRLRDSNNRRRDCNNYNKKNGLRDSNNYNKGNKYAMAKVVRLVSVEPAVDKDGYGFGGGYLPPEAEGAVAKLQ